MNREPRPGDPLDRRSPWHELWRAASRSFKFLPPLYGEEAAGQVVARWAPPPRLDARITGRTGAAYSWEEVYRDLSGWVATPGGRAGTLDAYEFNRSAGVPVGQVVRLMYVASDEWRFERPGAGDTPAEPAAPCINPEFHFVGRACLLETVPIEFGGVGWPGVHFEVHDLTFHPAIPFVSPAFFEEDPDILAEGDAGLDGLWSYTFPAFGWYRVYATQPGQACLVGPATGYRDIHLTESTGGFCRFDVTLSETGASLANQGLAGFNFLALTMCCDTGNVVGQRAQALPEELPFVWGEHSGTLVWDGVDSWRACFSATVPAVDSASSLADGTCLGTSPTDTDQSFSASLSCGRFSDGAGGFYLGIGGGVAGSFGFAGACRFKLDSHCDDEDYATGEPVGLGGSVACDGSPGSYSIPLTGDSIMTHVEGGSSTLEVTIPGC